MSDKKETRNIEKTVKPLTEGILKNNAEKPSPNIDKTFVVKPPAATPKEKE
jgi:hypothetical protein